MSTLVSRIVLAVLMLPTASVVCLMTHIVVAQLFRGDRASAWQFSGIAVAFFVGIYWTLLWGRAVRWNAFRALGTCVAAIGGLLASLFAVIVFSQFDDFRANWLHAVVGPLAWLLVTTFLWRETKTERQDRLRSLTATGIVCPNCEYNLTGLQGTRCPECGKLYTLDELLASQPGRQDAEISG